jgi:sec-independent protein translocase protein TatA
MGTLSVWHWLIVLVVAVLLFGGSGKISNIMGDVAKGIKSFKKGMKEDDDDIADASDSAKTIDNVASTKAEPSSTEQSKAS